MGSDHGSSSAQPEPTLPRWVRAADGLTVLLGLAALQAAVFGGFQMPGLSVTNPWRPLLMAAALAGLRHCLVRTPPLHAAVGGWAQTIWLADAARANRRELWPPFDLKFFRTLDFLVLSVVSISFAAIALLALNRFDARTAVIAGLGFAAALRSFTPARFDAVRASGGKPVAPVLVLVLLTALLFRTEPFPSLHNAHDSGVHVSMSAHLQREGSAFVDDRLPDALPDERSRDIYRAARPAAAAQGGAVGPGLPPSAGDGRVFPAYPLHPLWMAIFAELFGDAARFHALGFFGLLGVLGLSLLAFELTGSRPAAYAAGILVATNPLHVFFSRSPAAEAVAPAFSSLGFYYLARASRGMRRSAPAATAATLMALAAACLALVFFVRITGFLYLPALAPLFVLGAWLTLRDRRRARGRRLIGFCAAVAALYGVSLLYGLGYSAVGAPSVYERAFGSLLGDGWPLVTAGALALMAVGLAEVARNPFRPAVRRFLTSAADPRPWTRLASLLIAAALAGSVLQAYRIGFTERYADDTFYREFGIIGSGAGILLQSGAIGWLLYVTPWLAGIALWGMHRPPCRWPPAILHVFLAVCMTATLLVSVPVVPEHYYYARYLLGEVVPYGLVLAVTVTFLAAPGAFRRLGMAAILAAIPFQLYFTAKQAPVREGMQSYDVMGRVADAVGSDVLLFDVEGFREGVPGRHMRLQTPLTHYFGIDVFPYDAASQLDEVVESFEATDGGSRLWLLSPAASARPGLELYEILAYRDRRMDGAATIPVTIDEPRRQTLFLHRQR